MPLQTSNHEITDEWTELPAGDEIMVQLINSTDVQLWVGATSPAGDETGHILIGDTRIFRAAGLDGSKVFAKSRGNVSRLAVTAG